MRIGSSELLIDSSTKGGRYLDNRILNKRQQLAMEVAEVIQYRLSSTTSSRSSLNNLDLIPNTVLPMQPLVRFFQITSYRHSIVRFEYFTRSQPSIRRILIS